jgi:hypothetical protein
MQYYLYYDKTPVAVIAENGQIYFDDTGIEKSGMPSQWAPHIKKLLENSLPEGLRHDALVKLASQNGNRPSTAIELVPYIADLPGRFSVGDSGLPARNEWNNRIFSPLPHDIPDARIESNIPKIFFNPTSEPRVNAKPSFSGYQDKFTANLRVDGDKLSISMVDQETERGNVIVKPASNKYPFLAENEYVCMELARHAGLSVPRVFLFEQASILATAQQHLVVERFDVRMADGAADVLNISEFAPLMGLSPSQKYDPTTEQLFDFVEKNLPPENLKTLTKTYLFGCIVRNGDMHSKNFSLISDGDKKYLSPVYDMVNTDVYDDYTLLALKLGNDNSPKIENVVQFMLKYLPADEIEATVKSVKENLSECSERAFAGTSSQNQSKFQKRLEQSISEGASKILNSLEKIKRELFPSHTLTGDARTSETIKKYPSETNETRTEPPVSAEEALENETLDALKARVPAESFEERLAYWNEPIPKDRIFALGEVIGIYTARGQPGRH